jgi:membrane protease YdiL (CAAX protease family)
MRRHPVVSFVILAYLITWGIQVPLIFFAHNRDVELSNEDNFHHFSDLIRLDASGDQAMSVLLFNVGQFGPFAAALIMAGHLYGLTGVRDLASRIVRWNVAPFWYLMVIVLPLIVAAASLAIAALTDGFSVGPFSPEVAWAALPLFFLYSVVFNGLTEEPGWRGFALPHIQAHTNAYRASWIVGVIWGIWHLPFITYYNRDEPFMMIPSLFGLTLGIVGWTIVNTWIYNSTRSVWMIILLHGWNNTIQSYFILSQDNFAAQGIFTVFPWAIAIYLAKRYGEENLSDKPRPIWWPGEHQVEVRHTSSSPSPHATGKLAGQSDA